MKFHVETGELVVNEDCVFLCGWDFALDVAGKGNFHLVMPKSHSSVSLCLLGPLLRTLK